MDKEVRAKDDEILTLVVKSATRKEELQVSVDSTVAKFKEVIADKFEVDVQALRLIYAGRILKDTDTIRCLSIKNGYTVCIVIKPTVQTVNTNERSNHGTSSVLPNTQEPLSRNLFQHYTGASDIVRSMLNHNPAIQQVIERNPEVGHVINNPALLRQAVEIMRNPGIADEFRRTADRAMSNIESLPGGFNALQQMYYDIEEPLMNVTNEPANPFMNLLAAPTSNQQGSENRAPLPNPWSSNDGGENQQTADNQSNENILERLQNAQHSENSANVLLQILQDIQSLLINNSEIQSEEFTSLQQQLNNYVTQMLSQNINNQQSDNSNTTSEMPNPSSLFSNLFRTQPLSPDTSNNNVTNADIMSQLLTQLNVQDRLNNSVQLEERYRPQMQQLTDMGFENPQANLQALIASFGDLNGAIERLLNINLMNN